ncbi:hypothetical protein [Sulfuricystis thermophila]|uniref:hypothetical protein n=1 Tax=Sulfuricystis thermophila TaxID=2496847 RepID=UPI00103613E6|nr:hypothetical protein [Sulfuricystis thermophila]
MRYRPSSLIVAAEDRQQTIQPSFRPPEVTDEAPMDGIGGMAEVVVGELLQPFQLGVDGGSAGPMTFLQKRRYDRLICEIVVPMMSIVMIVVIEFLQNEAG